MRPKSINLFEIFGYTAAGIGLLNVLIAIIQMIGTRGLGASPYLYQIFLLILFGALAAATWMTARKRHDVARGAFFVIAAVITIALLTHLGAAGLWRGSIGALFDILELLTIGSLMAGAIALLPADVAAWMVPGGIKTPAATGGWTPPPGAAGGQGFPPSGGYPPTMPGGQPGGYGTPGASAGQPAAPNWVDSPTQAVGYPPPAQDPSLAGPGPGEPSRRCPYCAETIRAEAAKCRFCGSDVEPLAR